MKILLFLKESKKNPTNKLVTLNPFFMILLRGYKLCNLFDHIKTHLKLFLFIFDIINIILKNDFIPSFLNNISVFSRFKCILEGIFHVLNEIILKGLTFSQLEETPVNPKFQGSKRTVKTVQANDSLEESHCKLTRRVPFVVVDVDDEKCQLKMAEVLFCRVFFYFCFKLLSKISLVQLIIQWLLHD